MKSWRERLLSCFFASLLLFLISSFFFLFLLLLPSSGGCRMVRRRMPGQDRTNRPLLCRQPFILAVKIMSSFARRPPTHTPSYSRTPAPAYESCIHESYTVASEKPTVTALWPPAGQPVHAIVSVGVACFSDDVDWAHNSSSTLVDGGCWPPHCRVCTHCAGILRTLSLQDQSSHSHSAPLRLTVTLQCMLPRPDGPAAQRNRVR